MDSADLINKLSSEGLEKPLPHPLKQAFRWIVGTLVFMGIIASFEGFRHDIDEKLVSLPFILETLSLLALGIIATILSFYYARPDGPKHEFLKYICFALIPVWFVLAYHNSMYGLSLENIVTAMKHTDAVMCPCHMLLVTALPLFILFYFMRMGASVKQRWAGGMSALGVLSFTYLFMRYIEASDDLAHLVVWHMLPIILMCGISIALSKFIFRW